MCSVTWDPLARRCGYVRPVTLAVALAGAVLAVAAVAVAQRNANNERVWFAVSGLARFSITLGILLAGLFASEHASDFVIAVFALVVLCVIVAAIAQLRRTAGKSRKLRIFTGDRTDATHVIPAVAAALLLLLIPGAIVFVSIESFWLSTHGGGAAIALTGSFLVVVALFVSALARLILSAGLALAPRRSESVVGSTFASIWDSGEALGVVAATVLSLSAIGFGLWAHGSPQELRHAVAPHAPLRSLATSTPRTVLNGLAPVFMFTGDDPWPPQRVDAYLRHSRVVDLQGTPQATHPAVADLVDSCPRADRPCMLVEPACAKGLCSSASAAPVAYGRVAWRGKDARVSWGMSPFRGKLTGIAQWWIFAPYDRWKAPLFLGLGSAVQEHAADWEAVTIGFSRRRPLFVALTSHCGGTWRLYRDVKAADRTYPRADMLGQRLHPLVAYADGSHALYFEPQWSRTPDSLGCALSRASGWFRAVSYAANALDVTRDNVRALVTPVVGPEAAHVLAFPAYWSASNTYTFETPLDTFTTTAGSSKRPSGPGSPAKKDLFVDPVHTIFCQSTWHYDPPPPDTEDPHLPPAICV